LEVCGDDQDRREPPLSKIRL